MAVSNFNRSIEYELIYMYTYIEESDFSALRCFALCCFNTAFGERDPMESHIH